MALTRTHKTQLASTQLPSDVETIARTRSFMARSGMSQTEMAGAIGYAVSSLGLYLNGQYCKHHDVLANTLAIRAALKEYIDLHDVAHMLRSRGTHVETADFLRVRTAAYKALEHRTAYVVEGPPGTQKTWCCRMIEREIREARLGRVIYVYTRVSHTPLEFLRAICVAAQVPCKGTIDQVMRKLQFFLADEPTLLLIDEAQHLDLKGLEVLRQLLDLPPYFAVMMWGSHEFSLRLQHWQMEQWRSRVQATIAFDGPSEAEAQRIITSQLGVTDRADLAAMIADCRTITPRTTEIAGKKVSRDFAYISARLLFGMVEGMKAAGLSQSATLTDVAA